MRRDRIVCALLAAATAAVVGTATYAYRSWLPVGRALPGCYVGGKIPPGNEALRDWLEKRRARVAGRGAWIATPNELVPIPFGQLGIGLDVDATLSEVLARSHDGSPGALLYRAWRARHGAMDVPLSYTFDESSARRTLQELAPEVWEDPVDARFDLRAHRRIEDRPGLALDVPETIEAIRRGERDADAVFVAVTREVSANVTSRMLADVDVTKVLASYQTDFGGTGRGRAKNIARAAEALNGTILAPGATISFNDLVGPRRLDRGFAWAPIIKGDELEPGVGGGCCQVASTLHAAAVYGSLDIVSRRSHSRPSGYVPLGLDATVVYGEVDLQVRNPYDTSLILHAFLPKPGTLRMELLGRVPPGRVEYEYAVTRTADFFRRITLKGWLGAEERIRRQKGIRGYDVVSVVRVERPDGSRYERRYRSAYRPVPEVFWVGPGSDLSTLPELPKGADRVEFEAFDPTTTAWTDG